MLCVISVVNKIFQINEILEQYLMEQYIKCFVLRLIHHYICYILLEE